MATTTFQPYTGNGSNKDFNYSFPTFTASEVVVEVDGVVVDNFHIVSYSTTGTNTVRFDNGNGQGSNSSGTVNTNLCATDGSPKNNLEVIVRRDTNIDSAKATYTAGSSLKAADLTNNNTQILRALQEEQNTPITTPRLRDGSITSAKIKDSTIVEADLANSAVTQNKLANNSVGTPELINGSVNSDKILDGTIVNADINASAAIAGTKISPIFGSQTVITSGNAAVGGTLGVTGDVNVGGTVDGRDVANDGTKLDTCETNSKDDQTAAEIKTLFRANNSDKVTHNEILEGTLDNRYYTEAEADARFYNLASAEEIQSGETWVAADDKVATTAAIDARIIDLVDDVGGFVPIANETSFPTANPDINTSGNAKGGTIVSVKTASTNLVPSGTTVTIANGRGSGLAVIITGVPSTIPSGFGFLVETTATDHTYAFHRLTPKATEVTTVATNATQVQTVHTNISNINAVASDIANVNAVAADAADIGAVAAKATEIGRLGTADAVADMAILGTTDVVADLNTLGTADVVSDMNALAVSDVISDMNTLAVSDVISDMNDLATSGNITAMSTCSTNIASINSAAANLASAANFGDQYQVAANNPSTDGGGNALAAGDLYFNTSANELKVYNGSSWQGGVTASGSFASTTGNTFTGDNVYNDNVRLKIGTGSDIEIYHDTSNSYIQNSTSSLFIRSDSLQLYKKSTSERYIVCAADAAVKLFYDNSLKLETTSSGATVTGSLGIGTTSPLNTLHSHGDGTLRISPSAGANQFESGRVRFTENTSDLQGAYIHYNGLTNKLNIGTHAANDNLVSNDLTAITIARGSGNVQLPNDNGKLQLGAGQDLEIYHDGNNSWLKNSTGDFVVNTPNFYVNNAAQTETMISAIQNGAVTLKYNNSTKFETTSYGGLLTGNFQVNTVYPSADSSYDLGTNSTRFANAYVDTYYGDGSNLTGINTDLVSDTSPQLGGALDANGHNINIDDNNSVQFGNSGDLQIYHDGSHSYIKDAGTGNLRVLTNSFTVNNTANSANLAQFTAAGSVELFYDGSKKFETNASGASLIDSDNTVAFGLLTSNGQSGYLVGISNDTVLIQSGTGENMAGFNKDGSADLYYNNSKKFNTSANGGTFLGNLHFDDGSALVASNKITMGDSSDLEIFHSGTHSYIKDAGTGSLIIQATGIYGQNAAGTETLFGAIQDAEVYLNYDDSKKFETTSYGVQVSGKLRTSAAYNVVGAEIIGGGSGYSEPLIVKTANGTTRFTVQGDGKLLATNDFLAGDNIVLRLGSASGGDLQIYHDGSATSWIKNAATDLVINTANFYVNNAAQTETMISASQNGAVNLKYDDNTRFSTTSTGTHSSGTVWTFGASGSVPTLKAGGTNTDFRIAAAGTGGWVALATGNSSAVQTDRWYVYGTTGHFAPVANNTYDIGTSSYRVRNIYTNDLHLSNEGHSNDVDGTWGDWTIQEGESDLFLKNNRSGKKYKFNLTEVS